MSDFIEQNLPKNRESRVKKAVLNAEVNLAFYFVMLLLSFFSRRIFLNCLGDDFVGLTSTLNNLLGFLNLAELGIGSAIGYVLYKPLFEKDQKRINEIISVFGYLYRIIGFIILTASIVLSLFLPLIFGKSGFSNGIIYFAYFSFVTSSLIGYFANYKQTLLGADQKNYVVTAYFQTSNICKSLIQMTAAYYTRNVYLWVVIELAFGFIYSIILNWKLNQVYPWLHTEVKKGKLLFKEYPDVMKYTKQLFVHKIASFAQFQTTPFILYMFTTLKTVAFYTNYTLIVNQLINFANKFLGSTEAGIGNLIAENNKQKIFSIYQELTTLRYFIAGIELFGIYTLLEPFVSIWLGKEYIMNHTVLLLVCTNMFIMQTRGTNDQFLNGFGLFRDVWAPIAETLLSLSCAIILGHYYGLNGVLAGMLVGMLVIVCIWKPLFLFHSGLHKSILLYMKVIGMCLVALGISFAFSMFVLNRINLPESSNYLMWTLRAVINMSVFVIAYFLLLYILTPGMRLLVKRFLKK